MGRVCLLLMISVLALQESASKLTSHHWRAPTNDLTGIIGAWRSGVDATTRAETETKLKPVGKGWPWIWGELPPQNFYDCLYIYYACTDNEIPGWQENEGKCKKAYNYCVAYIASDNSSPTDKYLMKVAKPVEEFTVRPPPNQTKWEFDFSDVPKIPTVETTKVDNPSAEPTPVNLLNGEAYVPITEESDLTWTVTDPATANAPKLRKFDYTLVKSNLSWTDATDACTQAAQQAQLAKLDSNLKNDLAMEKLRLIEGATSDFGAWFGASRDPNANNNWIFTDGSAVNYTSWGPGEPNQPNVEKCAELQLNFNYLWNDRPCDVRSVFICETPYEVENPLAEARVGNESNKQAHGSVHQPINLLDGGAYAPKESELTWTWEDPTTFNASYIQKFAYTLFNKEALPWYAASNVCASMRARLAQPDSQQKVNFIAELLRSQKQPRAWFGGSPHHSGRTNWPAVKPYSSGDEEQCGEFWFWTYTDLSWSDAPCSFKNHFICETPIQVKNPLLW